GNHAGGERGGVGLRPAGDAGDRCSADRRRAVGNGGVAPIAQGGPSPATPCLATGEDRRLGARLTHAARMPVCFCCQLAMKRSMLVGLKGLAKAEPCKTSASNSVTIRA